MLTRQSESSDGNGKSLSVTIAERKYTPDRGVVSMLNTAKHLKTQVIKYSLR